MGELDKKDKHLIFMGIGSLKSEFCYEESQLGFYLENRLSPEELSKVENHLEKCLYCLNQLTEIKELIFLEKSSEPLNADQVKTFSKIQLKNKQSEKTKPFIEPPGSSFGKRVGSLLFSSFQWKYAVSFGFLMMVITLVSMYVTIQIKNPGILFSGKTSVLTANAENNIKQSSVKVDLFDPSGKNIQTVSGVVIDSSGLVLINLKELKTADSARVNFLDGSSHPVVGVQVDEARNLAILKISQKNLVPIKVSRPKSLKVGDQFIHILDASDPVSTASHVTVTRLSTPRKDGGNAHQYIELTGQRAISSKGFLVNPEGETIGKMIEGEGMVGSAVTYDFNESFAPSANFIPISLIGK